jgi:hypothetical protein
VTSPALTFARWSKPVRHRIDGWWTMTGMMRPTELHVSLDGVTSVCGQQIPAGATVVAVTCDWHKHANCYNCVYRAWPDYGPKGYIRPTNGKDFPPRRECPHAPGRELDPLYCTTCTPAHVRAAHDPNWPCPNGCTEPHELVRRFPRCTVFPPLRANSYEERCPPGECESKERAIRCANPKLFFDLADSASMYCYHCAEPICASCHRAPVEQAPGICGDCAAGR